MPSPRLAVIVPLFNEEAVLPRLLQRLEATLARLTGYDGRILLVNDGSSDATWRLIEEACARSQRIGAISLSRNFGHQAALAAALDYADDDAAVLMDGDLQDPPEVIPRFVELYEQGYDVVYARRASRRENVFLRAGYYAFYRLLASLANVRIPNDAGDFALMSRRVVAAIGRSEEKPKFLRGLRAWAGFRQTGVDIDRPERQGGTSKYTFAKLVLLALDGIFAFSTVPLRLVTLAGAVAVMLSMLYAVYALYVRFVYATSPTGFTALIVTVIFMSGLQLVSLGVIGEYIGRIFEQSKKRPTYVVERLIGRLVAQADREVA